MLTEKDYPIKMQPRQCFCGRGNWDGSNVLNAGMWTCQACIAKDQVATHIIEDEIRIARTDADFVTFRHEQAVKRAWHLANRKGKRKR